MIYEILKWMGAKYQGILQFRMYGRVPSRSQVVLHKFVAKRISLSLSLSLSLSHVA